MDRDRAMTVIERHQPNALWRLLRVRRCAACRRRWPCPHYLGGRTSLLSHDRADIAAIIRCNTRWPTNG